MITHPLIELFTVILAQPHRLGMWLWFTIRKWSQTQGRQSKLLTMRSKTTLDNSQRSRESFLNSIWRFIIVDKSVWVQIFWTHCSSIMLTRTKSADIMKQHKSKRRILVYYPGTVVSQSFDSFAAYYLLPKKLKIDLCFDFNKIHNFARKALKYSRAKQDCQTANSQQLSSSLIHWSLIPYNVPLYVWYTPFFSFQSYIWSCKIWKP